MKFACKTYQLWYTIIGILIINISYLDVLNKNIYIAQGEL